MFLTALSLRWAKELSVSSATTHLFHSGLCAGAPRQSASRRWDRALVMVPLTQLLIDQVGWRWTYVVTGSLLLLVLVPANALFQRRAPQDVGQFPDGDDAPPAESPGRHSAKLAAQRDWTLGEAARSFPFWCITIGHLALGTALFLINTHVIAHFVAVGYEKLAASFYFGLIGFIRIGATIVWGSISDRLGRSEAYGLATLVTALGVGCMIAMTVDAPLWLVDRWLSLRRNGFLRLVLRRLPGVFHRLRLGHSRVCALARARNGPRELTVVRQKSSHHEGPSVARPQPKIGISRAKTQRPQRGELVIFDLREKSFSDPSHSFGMTGLGQSLGVLGVLARDNPKRLLLKGKNRR